MGGSTQSKTYKVEKEHKKSGSELRSKSGEKKVDKEFSELRESIKKDINEAQKRDSQILQDTSKCNHVADYVKLVNNLSDDKNEEKVPIGSEQEIENRETFVSQENQCELDKSSIKEEEKIVEGPEDIKLPHTIQNLLLEVNADVCIENKTCMPEILIPESQPEKDEIVAEVVKSEEIQVNAENIREKSDLDLKETNLLNEEKIETVGKDVEVTKNIDVLVENEKKIELPKDTENSEIKKCELEVKEEIILKPLEENSLKNEKASEIDPLDKIEIITEPTPSNETNLNTKNLHVTIKENYDDNSSISASNESCKILNQATSSEVKENINIDLVKMDEINKITTTTSVDCEINNENLNQKIISNKEELETNDPLINKIFEIEREIKNFYDTVEGKGESYVLTLRELLIRSMVKLDNLKVNNELARNERKRVIKYAQCCLNSIPESTK